jgi:MFS family permease
MTIALGGLVGVYLLSEGTALATLPVTAMIVGTAAGTIPAAIILARIGRRAGFMLGAALAATGGLIAFGAILAGSFALYALGTFVGGTSFAFVQQYRFAATEGASERFRPKAISIVLAGGIFAGIIGPMTVIATRDLFAPTEYAGAYLAQALLALLAVLVLSRVRPVPPPPAAHTDAPRRPLHVILAHPPVALAILVSVVSYSVMSLVMTAAPLAMLACGFTTAEAALGIQWHVIAMFGPSFVTGSLIARFGAEPIAAVGLALLALAGGAALMGITLGHFYVGLILLGLGWNFGFIGGTAMLTAAHRPEERARVQGANEFIVFGTVALASLSSGVLFATVGWGSINWTVLPMVAIPFLLLGLAITSGTRARTDRLA